MPIDKSRPWGEIARLPAGLPVFPSEEALSNMLSHAGPREVRMSAGEFAEVTGGRSATSGEARRYPCDVLEVRAGHLTWWSIGTVELRRRRRRALGGFVIVSNLGQRSGERYSSRAHPNDGKFEIVDALNGLSSRERLMLSRRLSTGGDLSHPRVQQRQSTSYRAGQPLHLFIDGEYRGRHTVEVTLHADALTVYV